MYYLLAVRYHEGQVVCPPKRFGSVATRLSYVVVVL